MKPINMCTLEVRLGKCNLNLKSDGYVGVSLEMGQNISSMSPIKRIQSSTINFNTTLRMNIEKSLLDQPSSPKCRILLHLIRQNRDKKVIGIATIDVLNENNQGFKYHQFGQCADCQADIQVSITYGASFQLAVKSEIGYFHSSQSQIQEGNHLQQSRGMMSFAEDSILDNEDYNILKQSKAVSNIEPYSMTHPQRRSLKLKPRRKNDAKKLRKTKPQNFSSCAPEQIITHYETQIKNFEEELIQRDEWATGMKLLIQELEAENQILKEITIDEMEANNISNLEQGIEYVSKIVHSKFQASRSMIYESPKSQESKKLKTSQSKLRESEVNEQIPECAEENGAVSGRSLKQTRSYKDLPQNETSTHVQIQNSPQRSQICANMHVLESRQDLQNAIKILTGEDRSLEITQLKSKILELQEGIFTLKQQRQQLYDSTEELYSELKNLQIQRDSLCKDVKYLESELQRMDQYIEQIKAENFKIKEENQTLEKNIKSQEFQKINIQNMGRQEKNRELQRQLKQSLKAIEQFKNDALSARSEIITKEDQLNCYKMKFGDLGSMTDVFANNWSQTQENRKSSFEEKKTNGNVVYESSEKKVESTSTQSSTLHTLYSHFCQGSIRERKQLQHSLSQIIGDKGNSILGNSNSVRREESLKKLQTKINKMFIEMFKNGDIKNIKEIEKSKMDVGKQIEQIISLN